MGQTSHKNDQIIQPGVSIQQRVERNPEQRSYIIVSTYSYKKQEFFNFEFAHAMPIYVHI